MRAFAVLSLVLMSISILPTALAEGDPPAPAPSMSMENPPPEAPPSRASSGLDRVLTDVEVALSLAVLGFGLVALLVLFLLMWKTGFDYQAGLKITTVTLVIVGTLFIITAGFDSEQIAPAMGLFGTITGYLLGRENPKGKDT